MAVSYREASAYGWATSSGLQRSAGPGIAPRRSGAAVSSAPLGLSAYVGKSQRQTASVDANSCSATATKRLILGGVMLGVCLLMGLGEAVLGAVTTQGP